MFFQLFRKSVLNVWCTLRNGQNLKHVFRSRMLNCFCKSLGVLKYTHQCVVRPLTTFAVFKYILLVIRFTSQQFSREAFGNVLGKLRSRCLSPRIGLSTFSASRIWSKHSKSRSRPFGNRRTLRTQLIDMSSKTDERLEKIVRFPP